MDHVLSFEEAEQALKEARLLRSGKFVLVTPCTTTAAASVASVAEVVSPYTAEMAELFQEEFAEEVAAVGAHGATRWWWIYPSYFPRPSTEHGVGNVGDTDCGVCYACTTMDGECVDEQPAGTYLDWWRGQEKEALKRWASSVKL
jgi:hypothetical protein